MLQFLRRARYDKKFRILLIIGTVFLAVGLVGSFALWSLPTAPQPRASTEDQANQPRDYSYLEEEIKSNQQALEESPDDPKLLTKLANAYYDLGVNQMMDGIDIEAATGNLKKALANYESALENTPDDVELHLQAAAAAFYSMETDKAEEHYKQALGVDPSSIEARIDYGKFLLYGRSDFAGAKQQWRDAIALEPAPAVKETLEALIEQAEQIEEYQQQAEETNSGQ